MAKKRRIILIVLCVFLAAGFGWLLLKPSEPVYKGKTLSEWLEEASHSDYFGYEDTTPESVLAIRRIGTNALPYLVKMAAYKDTRSQQFLDEFYSKLISLLHLASQGERKISLQNQLQNRAQSGFYIIGSAAKPALPALIALLDDRDSQVREAAADCLSMIGPAAHDAVPALVRALTKTNEGLSYYSGIVALERIGPPAPEAVPFLISALAKFQKDSLYHIEIQAAIIKIRGDSLAPFIDQLRDTSDFTNWLDAAKVVGRCPEKAGPAVPFLVTTLADTNISFQFAALGTLGMIHQRPDLTIPAILPFLGHPKRGFRVNTIDALRRFGNAATPAVPQLIKCLDDPEYEVRCNATNAMRAIDPEAAAKAGVK
jgi:hypothetical protein